MLKDATSELGSIIKYHYVKWYCQILCYLNNTKENHYFNLIKYSEWYPMDLKYNRMITIASKCIREWENISN